jgi:hypothetical protein
VEAHEACWGSIGIFYVGCVAVFGGLLDGNMRTNRPRENQYIKEIPNRIQYDDGPKRNFRTLL